MAPKIRVVCGNIAHVDAELHINSANSGLLQGSGSAEQYVNYFGRLVDAGELAEYERLISMARKPLKSPLNYMHNVQKREPSKLQYACLKEMVVCRDSREIGLGDAVLINMGDYPIANAVGMTYDWRQNPPSVVPATYQSVRDSVAKSLGFAERLEYRSAAIPVMCTRKGRLSEKESSEATLSAINIFRDSLDEILIVLYNDELAVNKGDFEEFYATGIWPSA